MHNPWQTRRMVKTVRFGATASRVVGTARIARLSRMPRRRSMCWLKKPTTSPAIAIPIVLALTAKPIAAGVTL